MLAILGAVIGLFGSLMPEILKFLNMKEGNKHAIEMAKMQMEELRLRGEIEITKLNATADVEEVKALYEHSKIAQTGWKFVDGLISLYTGSVRPTITYIFIGTYALVKYAIFMSYTSAGYNWTQAVQAIWNSEDFAVFSTVIAFWFGARFLKYSLSRVGKPNGK